ncbi:MAG: HD domain-containing protein [Candidatus Thorarchaeota archaeon]
MLFIKRDLYDLLRFLPKNFDFFLDMLNLKDEYKKQIRFILAEAKNLPAALGGYHGSYEGGLYDHTLLVTNFVYKIHRNVDFLIEYVNRLKKEHVDISGYYDDLNLQKAIQTAIYHDFGKIPYYFLKLDLHPRKIVTNSLQKNDISFEITKKFNLMGNDPHVDECIAVLKKYNLPFDDDIYQGIIFHHGKWSNYKPFTPTKLSELIHIADMISSNIYGI